MGFFDGLKDWTPKKLFKAQTPDLKKYIGKTVKIDGKKIKIESIKGNLGMSLRGDEFKPCFYEINGEYLINMLRFHAQMENDKSITEEQFLAFENMEFQIKDQRKPIKELKNVEAEIVGTESCGTIAASEDTACTQIKH